MPSKLAPHMMPEHVDFDGIREWAPKSIKVVNFDYERSRRAQEANPAAVFVLRDHPLSEQHDDMFRDPEGTGQRHAMELALHITTRAPMIPREQMILTGINEPHVWDPNGIAATVKYYVAFLDHLKAEGLRGGALNLSVGWPANTGPDTPPNWQPYTPVHDAIRRGNHILILHEYWCKDGPAHMWGWWAGRYTKCPWPDTPIIIGECGMDQYVIDGGCGIESRGWRAHVSPEAYMQQLIWYDNELRKDVRVHSAQIFTWDFASPWQTFDVRDIRHNLIAHAESLRNVADPDGGQPEEPHPYPANPCDDIRNAAWNAAGISFNPGSAFYLYARSESLGRPVTNEFECGVFRAQGYEFGIVYAKVGDWSNVKVVGWL